MAEAFNRDRVIREAVSFVRTVFQKEYSGHDADHTMRVYRLALTLAREEGADLFVTGLAALLHDVDDVKLSPETAENKDRAVSFLRKQGLSEETIRAVVRIIGEVSFLGTDSVVPSTPEGRCVQDADRLDAIGAIGIARAFAFGGSRGRVMYDPDLPPCLSMDASRYRSHVSTTLNHFYEKLLLLRDMMTTVPGRRLAEERHRYMEGFVEEFLQEWDGQR